MADELKDISDKDTEHEGKSERSDRTKERIEDLIGKIKSQDDALKEERQARKNLEFELNFGRVSGKYPHAQELREQIKKSVDAGIPLEDAAIAELHRAGKLMTSEELNKQNQTNEALGGSADTKGDISPKSKEPQTAAEMRQKLVELEEEGNLSFDGSRIILK